jgi:hypothetical protein
MRIGLGSNAGVNPPPDGVWVKLLAGTDANWQYELYSGGALVGSVDSGVAYSPDNRYTALYRGDGSQWYVSISTNGGAFSAERSICPSGCAINGALPAVVLGPAAQIVHTATADGAVKRLYIDRFSISVAGLVR